MIFPQHIAFLAIEFWLSLQYPSYGVGIKSNEKASSYPHDGLDTIAPMVSPSLVDNNYFTQGLQLTKTVEECSPQQIAYTFWYYEG